jgi:hypothetical protein
MSRKTEPTTTLTNGIKSDLDAAWKKVQDGLEREAEGRELWIKGMEQLITALCDARRHLPADQEFHKWLTDYGYGEDRLNRHDRAALLNMGDVFNVTRDVLKQTHRRSWQLIWREEIQPLLDGEPRLPNARQPADGKSDAVTALVQLGFGQRQAEAAVEAAAVEAGDANTAELIRLSFNRPELTSANTRRPKKNGARRQANGERKPQWLTNIEGWYRNKVEAVNAITNEITTVMENCTPEQRKLLAALEPTLLLDAAYSLEEKSAEFVEFVDTQLEEAANALIQKSSRVVVTPRKRRASTPAQPGV